MAPTRLQPPPTLIPVEEQWVFLLYSTAQKKAISSPLTETVGLSSAAVLYQSNVYGSVLYIRVLPHQLKLFLGHAKM